ncbi:MAG: prephenate dehydratase domain-containing protein [Candidatus Pacearchaeota archaeon]
MKIAYLGPAGSFSEKTAKSLFPKEKLIPIQPIFKVIKTVENNKVDLGVVPIENFYNGEIRDTLDSLTESKNVRIIQEKAIKIIHCLATLKNNTKIKKILSKDTALEQCRDYINKNYPNAITLATSSTSEAVERIIREKAFDSAAIADENIITQKGLIILDKDLCPNNRTRFVVIGKKITKKTGNDKTFLVFHPKVDAPGSLQNYLGFFSNLNINLNYIQSRPDGKGGYYFYIELEGHIEDRNVQIALKGLRYSLDPKNKNPNCLKILGSYPKTDWKNGN